MLTSHLNRVSVPLHLVNSSSIYTCPIMVSTRPVLDDTCEIYRSVRCPTPVPIPVSRGVAITPQVVDPQGRVEAAITRGPLRATRAQQWQAMEGESGGRQIDGDIREGCEAPPPPVAETMSRCTVSVRVINNNDIAACNNRAQLPTAMPWHTTIVCIVYGSDAITQQSPHGQRQ